MQVKILACDMSDRDISHAVEFTMPAAAETDQLCISGFERRGFSIPGHRSFGVCAGF